MADPTMTGEPSQEELRAYLEQLRDAPAAEIVVQAYTLLGSTAETKLGRSDARTVIDAMAGMVEGAARTIPADLAGQMRQGVAQLQTAQVQLERQAKADEPAGAPTPAAATAAPPSPAAGPQPTEEQQRMTDRLWIPGRDPKPPSGAR